MCMYACHTFMLGVVVAKSRAMSIVLPYLYALSLMDFSKHFNEEALADVLLTFKLIGQDGLAQSSLAKEEEPFLKTFHLHSILIADKSPYFQTRLLDANFKPDNGDELERTSKRTKTDDRGRTRRRSAQVMVVHVQDADEVEMAEHVLRWMYSGQLDKASEEDPVRLMGMFIFSDRFQMQACSDACLAALSTAAVSNCSIHLVQHLYSQPAAIVDRLMYLMPGGTAVTQQMTDLNQAVSAWLLRCFGNIPAMMQASISGFRAPRHALFLSLPFAAVLAWLNMDALLVNSENCVLAVLNDWVTVGMGKTCNKEQLKQLAFGVRIANLSASYLHCVLPELSWFQSVLEGNEGALRGQQLVKVAVTKAQPGSRFVFASGERDTFKISSNISICGCHWGAPPRTVMSPTVSFQNFCQEFGGFDASSPARWFGNHSTADSAASVSHLLLSATDAELMSLRQSEDTSAAAAAAAGSAERGQALFGNVKYCNGYWLRLRVDACLETEDSKGCYRGLLVACLAEGSMRPKNSKGGLGFSATVPTSSPTGWSSGMSPFFKVAGQLDVIPATPDLRYMSPPDAWCAHEGEILWEKGYAEKQEFPPHDAMPGEIGYSAEWNVAGGGGRGGSTLGGSGRRAIELAPTGSVGHMTGGRMVRGRGRRGPTLGGRGRGAADLGPYAYGSVSISRGNSGLTFPCNVMELG